MKYPPRLPIAKLRAEQYEYHKTCRYSADWNKHSPYTCFKASLYMEGAAILVYLLQYIRISPNIITITYGLLGIIGGILLALPPKLGVSIAIAIFFFKGIIDLADGHYARLTNQISEVGKRLDLYCGVIGTISFYTGLYAHLAHRLPFLYPYIWFIPLLYVFRGIIPILSGRAKVVDFILFLLVLELCFT